MADFTIPNLGTAVVGFAPIFNTGTKTFTIDYSIDTSANTNISFTETRPGWLTGRRPLQDQLFPRGVYNK